jgi:hypothetical protein
MTIEKIFEIFALIGICAGIGIILLCVGVI